MKRESNLYLLDILEAINRIKNYVGSLDLDGVKKNHLILDAVLRNLEIIGEAVAQLPQLVKETYPEIPWRDIKDFRNVVAHRYWEMNLARIWDIIQNKLDPLRLQIEEVLQKEQARERKRE